MKLGSLFDGSGGFPLSGALCGIEPVWASEVEPYPIAVTRSRFPNMIHLGDVSNINGADIDPVDIVTFGSPCQDLSVAGKRAGLKHEDNGDEETTRSSLFMEAVRIIKEMREATNGVYPTFALWENVPGAFSSNKGEDFRTVLEELIKIVEPTAVMPEVPKAGWAYADCFMGDGWSLAYRTLDAQYWGVPQRRRRIYLVLDLRGERAGEILFKREGLRGYFETGGTPWQGTAGYAQNGIVTDDRAGNDGGLVPYTLKIRSGCAIDSYGKAAGKGALIQTDKAATLATTCDQYLFQPIGKVIHKSAGFKAGNGAKAHGIGYEDELAPTVTAASSGTNQVPTVVCCIDGDKIGKAERAGGSGLGIRPGDNMYTLTAKDRHAVAYSVGNGQLNQISMSEQSNTLDCMHDKQAVLIAEKLPTVRYIVRRLTPTECARLQGFPDTWGHPDIKENFTDEEYSFWMNVRNTHAAINDRAVKEYTKPQMLKWYNKLHTDSSEYKMWGNGIALPTALYVMQGIADALQKETE